MENLTGYIKSITQSLNGGYDVIICIYNSAEIESIIDFNNSSDFILHSKEYVININGNAMDPFEGSEAAECMDTYHQYEYSDNLNPRLRRMWKSGQLIDSFAERIISSGVLDKLVTGQE